MRRKSVTRTTVFVMVIVSLFTGIVASSSHAATSETTYISLEGTATGGELILAKTSGRNPKSVAINTNPGESAQSVLGRLVEAFGATDPFNWHLSPGQTQVTAKENKLEGLLGSKGEYFVAGTEKGLGIPEPPLSLSCSYDSGKDWILLQWENPPAEGCEIFFWRCVSAFVYWPYESLFRVNCFCISNGL